MFSVTRDIRGAERGDPSRREVLFDGLDSETRAWEAGHTWLMEHNLPFVCLDIREDGAYVGMVSWEPSPSSPEKMRLGPVMRTSD